MIDYAYNDHFCSSIGMNPYTLYGEECQISISLSIPNTKIESINDMIR